MMSHLVGTIVGIEPVAVYQDTVYEQTVTVTLENGTELDLFDGRFNTDQDMVGRDCSFVVTVRPPPDEGIEKLSAPTQAVEPAADPISEWSAVFSGRVDAVDVEDSWHRRGYEFLVTLDIGVGVVLVIPTKQLRELVAGGDLAPGDYVSVEAARTDVIDVRPVDDASNRR
ncbi:hypothetical protein ACFQH6_18680 [Halobacteriaceae archaeon GCM10025711]